MQTRPAFAYSKGKKEMVIVPDSRPETNRVGLLDVAVAKQEIAREAVDVIRPRSAALVDTPDKPANRCLDASRGDHVAVTRKDLARMSRACVLAEEVAHR